MSSISTVCVPCSENPVYILHSNAHLLAQCASVLSVLQDLTATRFRAYPRNAEEQLILREAVDNQERINNLICLLHDLIDPMCDQILDITDHYDLKPSQKKNNSESNE